VPSISGALATEADQDSGLGQAHKPLHIGLSVGHKNSGPGTLGAFVSTDQGEAILSNCHVLGLSGRISPKDDNAPHYIYQPGRPDVQFLLSVLQVAELHVLIDISNNSANEVDAAVALLFDQGGNHLGNSIPPGNWPDAGEELGRVGKFDQLEDKTKVAKIGRTTGYTTGEVSAVWTDAIVDIPGLGNAYFENLLEVTAPVDKPFSEPGDSGSLVFEVASRRPVGLHFAGGTATRDGKKVQVGYACNLEIVLEALGITLLG